VAVLALLVVTALQIFLEVLALLTRVVVVVVVMV
jgi:hypothetical protein